MRILHVLPSLSLNLGGPTLVAMNLVFALRQLGVEAEIATTNYGLTVPTDHRIDYTFDLQKNLTVPVWFFPYDPPSFKEFIFSRRLTSWLWQNLSTYDVIDTHYLFSYAPTCAAAIARFNEVPYTVRTMGQLSPWALGQSRLKKRLYSALLERRNLNRAAVIHCTAEDEVKDVRMFGIPTPTINLPLGVHPPTPIQDAKQLLKQVYSIPSDRLVLLFLSRIHYKKRPELLLQTVAELKKRDQCCHVMISGSGEADYLAELKALIDTLDISQQVTFTGFVNGYDKDLLLQGTDLFVLPSYSENFGIAVAEALVAGLPVVITPEIQIAPEIAAAKAGCVVPGELPLLVDEISGLLCSSSLRQIMGKQGQRLAKERYSWQTIAKNLHQLYKNIINSKATCRLG